MPYLAVKHRTIAGHAYKRGEVVDVSTLTLDKLASLIRVGLLVASDAAPTAGLPSMVAPPAAPAATTMPAEAPEMPVEASKEAAPVKGTGVCPICGDGPFLRLDVHARTHSARVAEGEDSHGNGD